MESKYFTHDELACSCCGVNGVQPLFLLMLEQLREEADFPFSNCSFYRCAAHNKHVGGKPNSAHLLGCGVDIPVYGKKALRILELAPKYGFTGIGINQKGPHDKRFIHLDSLPSDNGFAPRPWIWTY